MAKIWGYISVFLGGALIMAIIALKWFNGDDYSIEIKKLKQKRVTGDATMSPIIDVPEIGRKQTRKQKRLDKEKN